VPLTIFTALAQHWLVRRLLGPARQIHRLPVGLEIDQQRALGVRERALGEQDGDAAGLQLLGAEPAFLELDGEPVDDSAEVIREVRVVGDPEVLAEQLKDPRGLCLAILFDLGTSELLCEGRRGGEMKQCGDGQG
jgi:hypothetical protein